jgi:hypothetical protein
MRMIWLLIVLLPGLVFAQTEEKEDVWAPLRPMIGEWHGTGADGQSEIEAKYGFVLGDNYIEVWHRSVFQPSEGRPDGEVHEDKGFISYDSAREAFVLRQFHVEGFVNTYVLDSLSADGKTLVFNSEAVENAPPGTRAKWEIMITGKDELATSFHVAWPKSDFRCYSQNLLKRKK